MCKASIPIFRVDVAFVFKKGDVVMTKKRFVILLIAAVIVLIGRVLLLNWEESQGDFTPLTAEQKANVLEEYKTHYCYSEKFYQEHPLIWFDDNGEERNPGVFRYLGTYGDCAVLLQYGQEADGFTIPNLWRSVKYPMSCYIWLYNTNSNYSSYSLPPSKNHPNSPLARLSTLSERGEVWLTKSQLRQLTNDLEDWIAAGNY